MWRNLRPCTLLVLVGMSNGEAFALNRRKRESRLCGSPFCPPSHPLVVQRMLFSTYCLSHTVADTAGMQLGAKPDPVPVLLSVSLQTGRNTLIKEAQPSNYSHGKCCRGRAPSSLPWEGVTGGPNWALWGLGQLPAKVTVELRGGVCAGTQGGGEEEEEDVLHRSEEPKEREHRGI